MKSVLLIGLGRFGRHMAMKFQELHHEVLAIDSDEQRVNDALNLVTNAQIGDSTNEQCIASLGVRNFDLCVVAIGDDFQSSLEVTSLLKENGARKVVSRASRDIQEKFLLRNGADEVVYPEKQLASWLAIRFTSDHILDYIELDGIHGIFEVSTPKEWIGKTVQQVDVRRKYNLNIMGFKNEGGNMNLTVSPDMVLTSSMTIMVLGSIENIHKCFKI